MSFLVKPPRDSNGHLPGDEVDGLLRAFFRSEMPDPWPAMALPEEEPAVLPLPAPPARRWGLLRSRLALAASVAILLAGSFWLGDGFRSGPGADPSAIPDVAGSATSTSKAHREPDASGKTDDDIEGIKYLEYDRTTMTTSVKCQVAPRPMSPGVLPESERK